MKNTWRKITLWTKTISIVLICVYVLLFIIKNSGATTKINFIFQTYDNVSALGLMFFTSLTTIVAWWITSTVFRTMRKVRDMQRKNEIEKIEKDHKEMLDKASRLQTKPEITSPGTNHHSVDPQVVESNHAA